MPPFSLQTRQQPPPLPAAETIQSSENLVHAFTHPPGKVYLLHGDQAVFTLSLTMASVALTKGSTIAVVDGGNRFNVHLISRFAREHRIDPAQLLDRIFISRGFTCYQMEQALTRRLPAFLASRGSTTAMIFNPLETLYDEQAPLREVRQILRRVLVALQEMKQRGISVLIASVDRTVWPDERNGLFQTLTSSMDRVYRLAEDEHQRYSIQLEHHSSPLSILPATVQGGTTHGAHRTDIHQHHRQ
jgi:hypothetical protein